MHKYITLTINKIDLAGTSVNAWAAIFVAMLDLLVNKVQLYSGVYEVQRHKDVTNIFFCISVFKVIQNKSLRHKYCFITWKYVVVSRLSASPFIYTIICMLTKIVCMEPQRVTCGEALDGGTVEKQAS